MITAQQLTPVVNRLLDHVKAGTTMPASTSDDNFVDYLTMLCDVLLPEDDGQNEPTKIPILDAPTLEMAAKLKPGEPWNSRRQLAAAKLRLLNALGIRGVSK